MEVSGWFGNGGGGRTEKTYAGVMSGDGVSAVGGDGGVGPGVVQTRSCKGCGTSRFSVHESRKIRVQGRTELNIETCEKEVVDECAEGCRLHG